MADTSYWRRWAKRTYSRRALLRGSAALGAGLAAAGLAGCANTGSKPGSSASVPANQSANETPQAGGIAQLVTENNPPTLDPDATSSAYTHQPIGFAMSRAFQFQTGTDVKVSENYQIQPDLALSAESPDATTWTIKLRSGAKFHTIAPVNGHAVEAEDMKATFVRALAPASANRATFDMVDPDQIQTAAKDTVIFKLKYPYAPFPHVLASGYGWILPREVLSGGYDPSKTVIGSGPFIFDSYTPDVAFTFKKNPEWYEKGRPYLDAVRIAIVQDKAQEIAQFTSGHLDILGGGAGSGTVTPNDFESLKRDNPKGQEAFGPGPNGFYIFSQLRDPASPFLDIRVRQAMSLALDRDAIGKASYGPKYYLSPITSRRWGRWALDMSELPPSTAQWYKQDLAQAKKLLQEAGASNLTLKFAETKPQPIGQSFYTATETAFSMLSALPWKISLFTIDYNKDWVGGGKGVRYGNFPVDEIGMAGLEDASDVDEQIYTHFHSKSSKSVVGVRDPQLDAMIDKGRTIVNEDERVKAYKDIQRYIADKLYGINGFPGWYTNGLVQPWVRNWAVGTGYGLGTAIYSKLWLKK